ncbi:MOSC and FAD-binding oxidoreductase domain-containing protein [Cryptosporangium phraense]|uniref:MOSC domain-containing protein n=1 Tax=Cryptosporangium phraense TaxID=2593070 RepID=A0A545ANY3_9ACTN|nr:MOSC and FAD-binding oxidoreductase domain-containing protein [Cryptosporangium phraense]TQS43039.1 MOSC domain-containing protein [Cryptosporangium phraense]
MATLLSVNVGLPRDVAWNGQTVRTGIWKEPVRGPVTARRLNLDGDGQGDLAGHGGEMRAVFVYQAQSYDHWREHLNRTDLTWGMFGENFTVDGLADDEVCIGDRYRIGGAEFEVSQPRVTCYRLGLRLGEPRMPALVVAHHRPGFYLRVLREGPVQAGDDIVRIGRATERITIAVTDAQLYLPGADIEVMRRLLRVPALSPGWQGSFRELVGGAVPPESPAWPGFRPMRVTAITPETALVSSIRLAPTGPDPLPAARPGQYLTLRLPDAHVRSYSLSAAGPDGYRISVKREGPASTFLTTGLAVGDDLDVAAPRGEFVLDDGTAPIVLLSAGIGVTPVLAMLHALAAAHSTREVWWLHTTRSPADHALAAEAGRLIAGLPHARSHVYYTATDGRVTRSTLEQLDLPIEAQAYVCGPGPFLDVMTAALSSLGLAPEHVHTERFTSLAAINPGVVGGHRRAPHPPATPGTGPAVTFARAGLTVPFAEASLLELAEACDVPTRWACRTGVCHTCVTPLLAGVVEYAPEPLTPPGAGDVLLCCSRPSGPVVLDL